MMSPGHIKTCFQAEWLLTSKPVWLPGGGGFGIRQAGLEVTRSLITLHSNFSSEHQFLHL